MSAGIEALGIYAGRAQVHVQSLMERRRLALDRFANLMMEAKTVAMPFEDPVTYAVNAAQPALAALAPDARNGIECVVTATESGVDFSKSISTYVADQLGLSRNCRTFEVKQACYAGTAALRMALGWVTAHPSPAARALVICTDLVRPTPRSYIERAEDPDGMAYAEPSTGAGAVAMIVSRNPRVLAIEPERYGLYSYEVCDTCRPIPDAEVGSSDLSLLSYLDCLAGAWDDYRRRSADADFQRDFDYLAFHTPFGGLVRGAHRSLLRKLGQPSPAETQRDFECRVAPSLAYCRRVGNIMSGSVFLALAGTLATADLDAPRRVGLFSYGSGCSSELYRGVATAESQALVRALDVDGALASREELSIEQYDTAQLACGALPFGTRNTRVEPDAFDDVYSRAFAGRRLLVLDRIENYHRKYRWS